ncbi:hypothetical protein [Methylobacterium aerolatum]|uniref:Uncharacterized protein n=1 Tax=Methylobacterium aerolatum TaxID=418708 RepID=A0ABU0HYI3_9HYPH|nr:hypothetical protein [Methylobacterium aerolatum]MDQ0446755.1 hypothetical protein [Methylobacterium aerolatum]GJD33721.1 hypothetical protein FMGBMHLM_0614 [Methylobacterium aerolatum]
MSTSPATRCATPLPGAAPRRRCPAPWPLPRAGLAGLAALLAVGVGGPAAARPGSDGLAPSCFRTGGGTLEICRDGSGAEGVLAAPRACAFVRGAQLLHLARSNPPGSVVSVYQGESPVSGRGREDACPERRATDSRDGGTLRTGRNPEQLAMILAEAEARFGISLPERRPEGRGRRGRRDVPEAAGAAVVREGIGPRSPIAISGRDWAGEAYFYVFMLGQEAAPSTVPGPAVAPQPEEPSRRRRSRRREEPPAEEGLRRRIQIEARTLDFVSFEIRTRAEDGNGFAWTPVGGEGRGRRREPLVPAPVMDEGGQPLASACAAAPFDTAGLDGSISVVDRTYHYVYTDVLPEDCGLPPERRRMGLYLRTSKDLAAERVWSAPRRLGGVLPPGSLVRAARARDAQSWAVAYTCYRPANAPGGPVADICLQYTADLDPAGIGSLTLFSEPVEAARSNTYLGLSSGGDGAGRFDRSSHFWMTDAFGNLDVPASYAGRSGVLTWVDRLAPGPGGGTGSRIYGRPAYWATWTARRLGSP